MGGPVRSASNVDVPGFLRGAKLVLRAFARDDLEAYRRWLDDPRVTEYLEMGARPTREADCEAFWRLASESEDALVFAIVERKGGKVVGTCGLYLLQWICRRAQFNILIGEPSAWDKGYGSEAARLVLDYAFDKLNLNSVQLGVNADNARAVRSYEKVGFVHEGVRRQFIYRNGRYYDMVMMSVLRDEYRARAEA
jgi:RimJ/RimL family protein N-acetyltransferase